MTNTFAIQVLSILCVLLMFLALYLASRVHGLKLSSDIDKASAASKAVSTSRSVIRGQVAEQLFPLSIDNPFDPGDMKFLGQPVDYVVFSGANSIEEDVAVTVYFLEVKTGKSQLSSKQRAIKDAVDNGRVSWQTVRVKGISND
jgi:predicted Holliday junction resolvase-like endonuclease